MADDTFTFKSGLTVRIRRVDPRFVAKVATSARARFKREHGEPECPTYEVKTAGGDVEIHQHDETTVTEPRWKADAELQQKWREYTRLDNGLRSYEITETVRAIAIEGVLDEPGQEWIEKCAYYEIELPENPRDRKWDWICDIAPSFPERYRLAIAIQRVDDPVEATAQAAVESFRHQLGQKADTAQRD